jgi:TolB-like protein
MTSTPLDSWKEIASFFAKTTRTVQRWERTENLPVYRHVHEKCGTVYAFKSELLAWRDARSRNQDQSILRGRTTNRRLRLAVLPFLDLSAKHQLRHFEDALTYELIVQLAQLDPPGLGVIAYTSVKGYKGSVCNIAQIGGRLKVDFVLEGSVRLAARRVRIAAQLIRVHDETQLFADACARRWRDGFASQVLFAERMTRMVGKHLFASASPSCLSTFVR